MSGQTLDSIRVAFEERGVKGLEAILEQTSPSGSWIDALIAGFADPRTSVPATWMVRAYLLRGVELDRAQTLALLRGLAHIEVDVARLHACQSIAHLDIPARNGEQLARFLREGMDGAHKFTRAWATDAFHRLALQHPKFRAEAQRRLQRAARDPAASVRARARRIGRE